MPSCFALVSRLTADVGNMDLSGQRFGIVVELARFRRDESADSLSGRSTRAFNWSWNGTGGMPHN